MNKNNEKAIRVQLAKLIAKDKIKVAKVAKFAKLLTKTPFEIKRLDICTHGFCVDFIVKDIHTGLGKLGAVKGLDIRQIESFPWGIINPEIRNLRVAYEF